MKTILSFIGLFLLSVYPSFSQTKNDKESKDSLEFLMSFGTDLGNILEINPPTGVNINNFTLKFSIDLELNYLNDSSRFASTNEIHYSFGLQKDGLYSTNHLQNTLDELSTLHDFSYSFKKNKKLNFNVILKSETSIFPVYDGNYFSDYNDSGLIKGFANPYLVEVSPGFKYQPNRYLRISLSPYSFQIQGIRDDILTEKGIYIEEKDSDGKFKKFIFKRVGGASLNVWYDRKVKKWITMQYRLGISTDYFENFGKNCQLDGLFITKIQILKNLFLNHKATLKGELFKNSFKPYYSQIVMLSYSLSF